MKRKRIIATLLLSLVTSVSVFAHPHIGVDVVLQPKTANGVLERVAVTWVFDREAYSREIISDYDPDGNGILDADEIERIRVLAFENVGRHNYFLFLRSGDETVESPAAEGFRAELSLAHVSYSFNLPYRQRYEVSPRRRLKNLTFTLRDPTGYIAVNLSEFKPPRQSDNSPASRYLESERWEQFSFSHDSTYTGEMLVTDILFFPSRNGT